MPDTYICSGWACTDCTVLIANGESPADLSEPDLAAYLARIDENTDGYNLTLGLARDEHSCDGTADECDCERLTFTWELCDMCASNSGGERHAVSFWKITAS
jgi:hypothetical protein